MLLNRLVSKHPGGRRRRGRSSVAQAQPQRAAPTPEPDETPEEPITMPPSVPEAVPDSVIKGILDQSDNTPEVSRVGGSTYMHLSSLIDLCPRQYVLAYQGGRPHFNRLTGGHRLMFATGRAVEEYIRRSYVSSVGRDAVLGNLTCACRQTTVPIQQSDGILCERCGLEVGSGGYEELVLQDDEARIMGSPDLPILDDRGRVTVVEIKSMTKNQFDPLRNPLGNHVFQAMGYRRLFQLLGHDVTPYVIVLYANKQFTYGSPYKEFVVDVTGHTYQDQLDRAWEKARTVRDAIDNNRLPPRVKCHSYNDTPAKNCPVVGECFSRDSSS